MKNGKSIVENFHSEGILVHPWVQKDDFLKYGENPLDELDYFFNIAKVDGIFSESPYSAILARKFFA